MTKISINTTFLKISFDLHISTVFTTTTDLPFTTSISTIFSLYYNFRWNTAQHIPHFLQRTYEGDESKIPIKNWGFIFLLFYLVYGELSLIFCVFDVAHKMFVKCSLWIFLLELCCADRNLYYFLCFDGIRYWNNIWKQSLNLMMSFRISMCLLYFCVLSWGYLEIGMHGCCLIVSEIIT